MQRIVNGDFAFLCEDGYEVARARSLYTKEPGTIAWLRETLVPGDVFYDIGANIGCYSLIAARLVGSRGHVYAFEPHVFNAASLLRNITANGLEHVITVVVAPLSAVSELQPFRYSSLRPGSSGHQFGIVPDGPAAVRSASVLMQSVRLRNTGLVPDVVKIDVDGLEYEVLRGMSFESIRSLQVEMPPSDSAAIASFLLVRGFVLAHRHYTRDGQRAVENGVDPSRITDNAIFERVAVAA